MTQLKKRMFNASLPEINLSLEERGWVFLEKFVTDEFCKSLLDTYFNQSGKKIFKDAKIGLKNRDNTIRKGSVLWIDDWNRGPTLEHLNLIFSSIMKSLNRHFRLSMKSFESQFSIYNQGGFYKCHLDQHKQNKHRQVSCCLYLNDCIDGGELILYKRGSKEVVDSPTTKFLDPLNLYKGA